MDQPTCILYVTQIVDMLQSGNVDSFVQLFIPNAELILPRAYCVGQSAIRNAVTGMYQTIDDIAIDLERVFIQDDFALVQWRWSDRRRLTGSKNERDTAIVIEFNDLQIKRWREYHAPVLK